jgi:hypothetical protein
MTVVMRTARAVGGLVVVAAGVVDVVVAARVVDVDTREGRVRPVRMIGTVGGEVKGRR